MGIWELENQTQTLLYLTTYLKTHPAFYISILVHNIFIPALCIWLFY